MVEIVQPLSKIKPEYKSRPEDKRRDLIKVSAFVLGVFFNDVSLK
jgi:hypothetical protein